ncbi:histone-lysine N-methyltransferase ASHH2-like isoform X2 [Durio zibethinus]|uniref:Histone-lysine N-methyltransferase ASHH2-like isoform X2 n=1 Tax=Durio zibethinus TaxID=66656 RepID=A0A6P5Z9A7_DURZI|nr:histone-lysine N-methyltransferase ASHH2-like isoform X2 [Durio zibethinus]
MGSCQNTTLVSEPLHEVAAAEQHSCSESRQNVMLEQRDCIVVDSNGDCAGELGEDENTGCERSKDIDFISREGQVVGFGLKELMGDQCFDSTVCLEENQGEIAADVSCSKELMGDMHGDSAVFLEENQGQSVDGSSSKELMGDRCRNNTVYSNGCQGENMDGSFAEELMSDRCGDITVCSNENQSKHVDGAASKELIGDNNGDCMICFNENQDENVDASGSKEIMGDRCGDTVVCLNDNQGENLDGSGSEKLMGDGDSMGYSNKNLCENVDHSDSKELMVDKDGNQVVCLDKNQGAIDKNDSETDMLCLKNKVSLVEGGAAALDGSLGLSQDESTASLSSGMEISINCEDQMKDNDENVVGLMLQEFMDKEGGCLTENQGIIDHHDSENDASQEGELPSELKKMTCCPRNCVKQDKRKDDERVSGSIMQGIMEDVVRMTGTDVLKQILPSQKCEVPFELINVTGEHRNKDDPSRCCSYVEIAMEEKHEILAEIVTKFCNQIPSIQGSNFPSESLAIAGCRSDCSQENDLNDSNIVKGPALDGKSGASPLIESDTCSQLSASCCAETISNLQRTGDSVSSCDWHNHKDDLSSSDLSLECFTKHVEPKSNDDICIELLASQGCLGALEILHRPESLRTWQNAQSDNKNVSGPSGDGVAEVFEGRNDVTAGTMVEASSEIINAKENACNSKGDSFELGAGCLFDKSASLSCRPIDVVENLSGRLDPPDLLTKDTCAAISSSSSTDCSGQRENEGKDLVKADCVSETKHDTTTSSSSRRGSRKSKSSRKNPAKRAARNCRNTKLPHPHESIEFLFKASRRKRSCSSKPARSSIWGLLSNITQFLEPCPDPVCNEVQNQEPSKAGGGRGSGKRSKNRAGQNSRKSSGLSNTSTSCLRLKIKVGKEVAPSNLNTVVAEVIDPLVSFDSSFSNYGKETNLQFPKLANVIEDKVELGSEMLFQFKEDQEKVKASSDASIMDVKLANKVVGSAENLEKSAEVAANNYCVSQSDAVAEASGEAIEHKYMDPGTSPDSEVINSIPDAQVGLIHQEESHDTVLNTSGAIAFTGVIKSSKGSKQGKKDNHSSPRASSIRRPKSSKNCRGRQKATANGFVSSDTLTSSTGANSSRENEPGVSEEAMEVEINMDAKACCNPDVPDTKNTKNLSSSKHKRNQLYKSSKSQGVSKGKSRISDSVKSRKGNACKLQGDELKSVSKSSVKEKGSDEEIVAKGGKHSLTGNHILDDTEGSNTGNSIASVDMANVDLVAAGVMEQHTQPDDAWVRCDDCHKWRRIPVALVKSIDEACRWICGDNRDKAFADCSIPQEKSNADINTELGISDAEEDGCDGFNNKELEKGFESKRMTVPPLSHFWRIDSNQFLHRGRKTQTIDEIMVCHCKRPPDGKLGCGDECLNRMLNIECVQGTCPCGDLCSNQQFQKRKYAKMKWDRFGKKGFGLRILENISAGHFLIEYVGEVLDMQSYEARQKEYASRGQRHFYFMTLNGSEVIDAYVKGNLGRFINHSCDPNCRTEKWMVNGEICIGLFAVRDIKKGEEVTFDYNYVRVFGAAAKKCHCGSPHCRGYIGGDPLSAEVIVHDDSDEESPEPEMLEDGETWNGSDKIISGSSSFDGAAMQSVGSVITGGVIKLENKPEAEDSVDRSAFATSKLNSSVETEDFKGNFQVAIQPEVLPMTVPCEAVQPDGTTEQKAMNKTPSSIQKLDTSLNVSDNKLSSDIVDANKKSKFDTAEDKQVPRKSRPMMKTCRSSGSIKKGKNSSNSLNGNKVQITSIKSQVPSVKPKKFLENSSTCRFETVEEKLNELLDSEGGITKRKDASKGYLKLLLLTATSGDSGNGEAIQSNRELSMILDALLKTKSRLVLTDIINKNGLQMLHNIMKKYRRDFKKIPILRKLLKVLEYLAMREILTLEHINGGPPCAGRESFRESILSFTEHDDKQVHQIARNFRDRWIPKPVRKLSYRDKDEGRMEFHRGLDCNKVSAAHNHWRDQAIRPTEAISCIMQTTVATTSVDTSAREGCSSSSTGVSQTNGTKIRKRKSRWDQPADTEKIDSPSPKKLEYSPLPVLVQSMPDHTDKMSRGDKECPEFVCKGEAINFDNGRNSFQDDVPPGFSSPSNASMVSSTAPSTATDFPQPKFSQLKYSDMIVAHPQKRFISRLPVSYGIPLHILQQFGSPQGESVESWVIVPGMPFHPFPPLPPCPRDKKDTPPACAANSNGIKQDLEERQDSRQPATSYLDENIHSAAGGNPPDTDIPVTNIQQAFKRTRESSYDLGKKYFRQQKRKGPPWRKSECMGNNHIGVTSCTDVVNVKNELRNSYYSDDITYSVGEGRGDFYQQPQHPNQH